MAAPAATRAIFWAVLSLLGGGSWADYPVLMSQGHPGGPLRCEPIRVPACQKVGYNFTSMPNLVGTELQKDAESRLDSFNPLIQYGCSSQIQFFLCSIYTPMCTPQIPTPIGPCRDLCETVRDRCAPVMAELGFPWPAFLNCSRFPPENNEEFMCMEGPGEKMPLLSPPTPQLTPPPKNQPPRRCSQYAHPHKYRYVNATSTCAPLCQANISFTSGDKSFAGVWMGIWAVVCFAVTFFTLISFGLEPSSFRYPDRAAVNFVLCYCLVSIGYMVRLLAGGESVACYHDPELGQLGVTEGALHTTCALVFLLLYYFTFAASVWWDIVCVGWLLVAWRGWSHDQLSRHASLFHLAAWGLPAAQAIVCLVLRKVDSDELTGICYAGQQNTETLVRFVLVPQFLYLVTGATLVLLVFACLYRARSRLKADGLKTDRVDVTVARVGVVAVLYMIPSMCQVAATFYEYVKRETWLQDPSVRPNMEVFMLKIFMSVAVGITGGLFLVNGRVLNTWKQFFRRFTAKKQPLPPYLQASHLMQTGQGGNTTTGSFKTTPTGTFKNATQIRSANSHQYHHFYQHRPPQEDSGLADIHGGGGSRCLPKQQHHHHHHLHHHQHHLPSATTNTHHHHQYPHPLHPHGQPQRGARTKCGSETQV